MSSTLPRGAAAGGARSPVAGADATPRDAGRGAGPGASTGEAVAAAAADWQQRRERGSAALLRLMIWICLRLGRPVARVLLYPIIGYFQLASPDARRHSRAFLARALAREPTHRDVFRHLFTFGANILDRVFFLARRDAGYDVRLHDVEIMESRLRVGQGVVLFGAHLGSFEAMRAFARHGPDPDVLMMMDNANAAMIMSALRSLDPTLADAVVDAGRPEALLQARERIEGGAIVGILGDRRHAAGDAVVPLPFLGATMGFPRGPMLAAIALRAPIVFGVGLSDGDRRYDLHFVLLHDGRPIPRSERAAVVDGLLRRYSELLDHFARQAPYNWFNFHDVWRAPQEPPHAES